LKFLEKEVPQLNEEGCIVGSKRMCKKCIEENEKIAAAADDSKEEDEED